MDNRVLLGWLNQEDLTESQKIKLIKLWDFVFAWGAYEGYYTLDELAKMLHIRKRTLRSKLETFKKAFPEAYVRIAEHRGVIKRATTRLIQSLKHPTPYDPVKHDEYISEKF